MAKLLYFRGQAIGHGVVDVVPQTQALTPPVEQTGLFQTTAGVVSGQGVNLLHAVRISVYLKCNTPEQLALAAAAIQGLLGLTGEVAIRDTGGVLIRGIDWVLAEAPAPDVLPGFGGRYVEKWTLTFKGARALTAS